MASSSNNAKVLASEKSENLSPWLKRWNSAKIGWHKEDVHHVLLKYAGHVIPHYEAGGASFDDEGGTSAEECKNKETQQQQQQQQTPTTSVAPVTVFVPLCGKTVDMAFLANQSGVAHVVGLDGIRVALEEFAQNHPSLNIKVSPLAEAAAADTDEVVATAKDIAENTSPALFETFVGDKVSLLKGDFFHLPEEMASSSSTVMQQQQQQQQQYHPLSFDVVWDRASLVAIQPSRRQAYVDAMHSVVKPGGTILLVSLDRRKGTPEARSAGPPFSLDETEIRRLYETQPWVESVEILEEFDEFQRNPSSSERFRAAGLECMYEMVYLIKTKKE